MQLGTRWTSGDAPPASLPDALREAVRSVDASMPTDDLGQPRPRWTLTYLERVPIAELDTGVIVTLDPDGSASVRHDSDDGFA